MLYTFSWVIVSGLWICHLPSYWLRLFSSHTFSYINTPTFLKSSPCYVSNRQIHEYLGVPLFADHIRALTESFDSKVADVGNPLLRQLGRYLLWPRVDPVAWRESQGRQGTAGRAMAKSTKRIAFGTEQPSALRLPWLRFTVIFLSCKCIRCKVAARPAPPPPGAAASPKRLTNVA